MNHVKTILILTLLFILCLSIWSAERSSKWEKVRLEHLQIEAVCAWCGQSDVKKLEVHHIKPFHVYPNLELEQSNLITFCRFCHFVVGHNCNWEKENVNCRKECEFHRKNK